MQDYHSQYEAPTSDWTPVKNEKVVELASPWRRIVAYIINIILFIVVMLPVLIAMWPWLLEGMQNPTLFETEVSEELFIKWMANMPLASLLLLVLTVVQCVIMSKWGQSIGKKIMGIKVVTMDGENPGFVGTVFLREVVFEIICIVIGLIPILGDLLGWGISIALLVMIFLENNNRQTLQDMLAKTLVVKA